MTTAVTTEVPTYVKNKQMIEIGRYYSQSMEQDSISYVISFIIKNLAMS